MNYLKITSQYSGFLNEVYVGYKCIFIEVHENGYEKNEQELAQEVAGFNLIAIYLYTYDKFKSQVAKLCKEIQKLNPQSHIVIFSDGKHIISGVSTIRNIEFVVFSRLKKFSDEDFHVRINSTAYKWFAKNNTKFVYDVIDADDLDEINDIMNLYTVNRNSVFVTLKCGDERFHDMLMKTYLNGFNLYIAVDYTDINGLGSEEQECDVE